MSEYGIIGAVAPNITIVDPLGLHDPVFAHGGFDVDRFLDRQPDFVWLPPPAYTKLVAQILDSDRFWQEYVFYPKAFGFGAAIRKQSPRRDAVESIVRAEWRELYGEDTLDAHAAKRTN